MSVDLERDATTGVDDLRAALRLCFTPEVADRLAALSRDEIVDARSLASITRAARVFYGIDRLTSTLRSTRRTDLMLGPRSGVTFVAALSLALHVGLRLSADQLSRITGRPEDQIGIDLFRARRAVEPSIPVPCADYIPMIGRQPDPIVNRDDAASLMLHLSQCSRCRLALDRQREIDARLLAELSSTRLSLGLVHRRRGRVNWILTHRSLWLVAGVFCGLLILAAGVAFASRPAVSPAAAPLSVPGSVTETGGGWLLETTALGEVDALNVATGAWRGLIQAPATGTAQDFISPNHQLVAQATTSSDTRRPGQIRVYRLDGLVEQQWSLSTPERVLLPLAWENNTTMIMSSIPTSVFTSDFELFTSQSDQQGKVVLFNVNTGHEQTIFNHGIRSAVPSPDGRFIAISRYAAQTAGSVELRPFDGNTLGPAIASFNEGGFPIFWSPDSGSLYFTQSHLLEATPVPLKLGDRGISGQPGFSYSIDRVSTDGQIDEVVNLSRGVTGDVAGLSPDGQRLIFVRGSNTVNGNDWAFWQASRDGTNLVQLAPAVAGISGETAVWTPDGATFLTSAEPFYLPQAAAIPMSAGPSSYVTLMIDPRGHPIKTLTDQLSQPALLAFVPNLPSRLSDSVTGTFSIASSVPGIGAHVQLTSSSEVGPGGNRILLHDRASNLTVAAGIGNVSGSVSVGSGKDPAWLPDESGVVSVNDYTLPQGMSSRITISQIGTIQFSGPTEFDPAFLGAASYASYRLPRFSPDGLHLSFFVVRQRRTELWIAGRGESPRSVAAWNIPEDARMNVPIIAKWISNGTLIVAVADNWSGGYPSRVSLESVQIPANGPMLVQSLTTWGVHGTDRGISIMNLELSPDHLNAAVRLRHYTGSNASRDRFDSIDVISTSNWRSAIELARGTSGEGVSWSPTGGELVAALDGHLVVATASGSKVVRPSVGAEPASNPVWVKPNEIWFTSGDGNQESVQRIER